MNTLINRIDDEYIDNLSKEISEKLFKLKIKTAICTSVYELSKVTKIPEKTIHYKLKKGFFTSEIVSFEKVSNDKRTKYKIFVNGNLKDKILQYRENKKKQRELKKIENKKITISLIIDKKTILENSLYELLAYMNIEQDKFEFKTKLPKTKILNLFKQNLP